MARTTKPLTNTEVKQDKARDKIYTLSDVESLQFGHPLRLNRGQFDYRLYPLNHGRFGHRLPPVHGASLWRTWVVSGGRHFQFSLPANREQLAA